MNVRQILAQILPITCLYEVIWMPEGRTKFNLILKAIFLNKGWGPSHIDIDNIFPALVALFDLNWWHLIYFEASHKRGYDVEVALHGKTDHILLHQGSFDLPRRPIWQPVFYLFVDNHLVWFSLHFWGCARFSSTLLCFKFTFLFFFKVFLLQWLLCAPVVYCQPRHKAFKRVPEQNIDH